MIQQDTRALAHELYDAYQQGDAARVAALIDDKIDWIIYAPMEVFPFAGVRSGKQNVLDALQGFAVQYELKTYKADYIIADGDRAAAMLNVSFVQRATGRTLSFQLADFLRFRNGRIVEFREFANSFDIVEQALGRQLPTI